MPVISVRDRNVHYLDQGAGVPVVLVHSSGLSSRQWTRLAGRLASQAHRVIAPDLLGSGASDPVAADAPFHFGEDVAALEGVLDVIAERSEVTVGRHLPPSAGVGMPSRSGATDVTEGRYHLVGHSYGGLVALTAARQRPERVISLALFEPVAFGVLYSEGDRDGIASLEDYDPDGTFFDDAAGGREPWLERFIDWWQGEGAWRGLPQPARSAFLRVGRKVFQEVRSLTLDRTPLEAYRALTMPVLLMSGARSPLAARRVCELLARALPAGRLVTLEDAGHMGPLTHGQAVAELILDHLRVAETRE